MKEWLIKKLGGYTFKEHDYLRWNSNELIHNLELRVKNLEAEIKYNKDSAEQQKLHELEQLRVKDEKELDEFKMKYIHLQVPENRAKVLKLNVETKVKNGDILILDTEVSK